MTLITTKIFFKDLLHRLALRQAALKMLNFQFYLVFSKGKLTSESRFLWLSAVARVGVVSPITVVVAPVTIS
jgi:hypothetical protein